MKMMYKIIALELKSANSIEAHPQDYLNFYCLGNREPSSYTIPPTTQPSNEVFPQLLPTLSCLNILLLDSLMIEKLTLVWYLHYVF